MRNRKSQSSRPNKMKWIGVVLRSAVGVCTVGSVSHCKAQSILSTLPAPSANAIGEIVLPPNVTTGVIQPGALPFSLQTTQPKAPSVHGTTPSISNLPHPTNSVTNSVPVPSSSAGSTQATYPDHVLTCPVCRERLGLPPIQSSTSVAGVGNASIATQGMVAGPTSPQRPSSPPFGSALGEIADQPLVKSLTPMTSRVFQQAGPKATQTPNDEGSRNNTNGGNPPASPVEPSGVISLQEKPTNEKLPSISSEPRSSETQTPALTLPKVTSLEGVPLELRNKVLQELDLPEGAKVLSYGVAPPKNAPQELSPSPASELQAPSTREPLKPLTTVAQSGGASIQEKPALKSQPSTASSPSVLPPSSNLPAPPVSGTSNSSQENTLANSVPRQALEPVKGGVDSIPTNSASKQAPSSLKQEPMPRAPQVLPPLSPPDQKEPVRLVRPLENSSTNGSEIQKLQTVIQAQFEKISKGQADEFEQLRSQMEKQTDVLQKIASVLEKSSASNRDEQRARRELESQLDAKNREISELRSRVEAVEVIRNETKKSIDEWKAKYEALSNALRVKEQLVEVERKRMEDEAKKNVARESSALEALKVAEATAAHALEEAKERARILEKEEAKRQLLEKEVKELRSKIAQNEDRANDAEKKAELRRKEAEEARQKSRLLERERAEQLKRKVEEEKKKRAKEAEKEGPSPKKSSTIVDAARS